MRFAVLRFRHPQDWHYQLLIDDCERIRTWTSQNHPLSSNGPLTEREDQRRKYLSRAGGEYLGSGFWERVYGGMCEVEARERRLLVELTGEIGGSLALTLKSKQAGVGARWSMIVVGALGRPTAPLPRL